MAVVIEESALDGLRKFMNKYSTLAVEPKHDRDDFMVEFRIIKQEASDWQQQGIVTTVEGVKEENRKKNRYKDILPYDATRVVLPKYDGECSDYINASYVKGPEGYKDYIASQGPMAATVEDFWRMVWMHKPKVIAMLCKEIELGKHRCQRYWPEQTEEMKFGKIKVSLESDKNIGDNLHRRHITYSKGNEVHSLSQVHYTAWPDHGAPLSHAPILHLLEEIRKDKGSSKGPVVVHCSAGCGRTGAVIAIDYARQLIEAKSPDLDIMEIIRKLRMQRPAMVQSKEQYEYVYNVVHELAERELKRIQAGYNKEMATYVNIPPIKFKEDAIYVNTDPFPRDERTAQYQRSQSLVLTSQGNSQVSKSNHPPQKPPKKPARATSSSTLENGVKVTVLPSENLRDTRVDNFSKNPGSIEKSNLLSSQSTPNFWPGTVTSSEPDTGRAVRREAGSDYEVPYLQQSTTSSNIRSQVAKKPNLLKKITPPKINQFPEPPSGNGNAAALYSVVEKSPRSNRQDNNYEEIWSSDTRAGAIRWNTDGSPVLPERTPESYIPVFDSSQEQNGRLSQDRSSDSSDGYAVNDQFGWLSGKLKKFGNMKNFNISAPQLRKKNSGTSDSVFYPVEEKDSAYHIDSSPNSDTKFYISAYPITELGFKRRVPIKAKGPRPVPGHWPNHDSLMQRKIAGD